MRMNNTIKVTLKSDLCVSTGFAYAGTIDTDVCMDSYGFPYIPAKRLKGVMREAASLFCGREQIIKIFGEGGLGKHNGIQLGDAILAETEQLRKEIKAEIESKDTILAPQHVLDLFTSVKAQTRIGENGVAENNTLRYTRVVNQYLPKCMNDEQKEVVFYAPIEYEQDQEVVISRIIQAVRHIGMDRNRGLGNVKCELQKASCEIMDGEVPGPRGNSEKRVRIDYVIRNIDQLMLSASKDDISENHISGQAVLGALASMYLRRKGLDEPDEVFRDLFLSGKSVFSNLYLTDEEFRVYYPAPLFINRLKKSKKYVCVAKEYDGRLFGSQEEREAYDPNNGNQPKKLLGKFVTFDKEGIRVIEARKELVYHHSKNGVYEKERESKDGSGKILYDMEVLAKDQLFSGSIVVAEKYTDLIQDLLRRGQFRFGKSKSAQYGRCRLEQLVPPKEYHENTISLQKGKAYIIFESDAIIPGKFGYTVRFEDIQAYLAEKTGLKIAEHAKTYMNTKTVTGYHAKMNLKKASMPAVEAGSVFEFQVPENGNYIAESVGSYQSEGFGKIRIISETELQYSVKEMEGKKAISTKSILCQRITREIAKKRLEELLKAEFVKRLKGEDFGSISAALLGRVTLMLNESKTQENALENFAKRILSIKRIQERDIIIKKLGNWNICSIRVNNDGEIIVNSKFAKYASEMAKNNNIPIDESAEIEGMWIDYLIFILQNLKYQKSAEKMSAK